MKKMKIGIIGCGNISGTYLKNAGIFPKMLEIAACADINKAAADAKAAEFSVKSLSVKEIMADKEIELIVNLTIPAVHSEINMLALESGKHVYCEKPFAVELTDGIKIAETAKRKKLRIGSAPDTFLGAGYQTCRKILDDGWIGKATNGTAVLLGKGPEGWHPNPFFFYQKGAGPMFDMGPYYMTALVALLGPVKYVTASATSFSKERTAGHKDILGEKIKVEVPTHYTGFMEFHSGAIITVIVGWETYRHTHGPIQIHGTEGSMQCPDPNAFGGPVKIFRPGNQDWADSILTHSYSGNSRMLGVADMISGIRNGKSHRCSGELAVHVLEVMHSFEASTKKGGKVEIKNKCQHPQPLKTGLMEGLVE